MIPVQARSLLLALLCLSVPTLARAEGQRTGRVSDVRGTLSVLGEDEDDVSTVYLNGVVREGDTLWTDPGSETELELGRGNWVRMAESTKLEVRSLNGTSEFRLWNGSVYFDRSDREEGAFLLRTPVGDVEVYPDSRVRVDLGQGNDARVSVYSGRARVTPQRGEALQVRAEERLYLEDDEVPQTPARFDPDDRDAFDQYQRDRVDYYRDRPAPKELTRDLPGSRELDRNGTWVEVERVRYWRPNCSPDWRPYLTGNWCDVPRYGYTWVDYHPWGYTTTHYGRWVYRPTYGWLWWPAYTWAPCWVYWSTCGDYIGWCPLDPWDRPCYYGPGNFTVVNVVFDFRSWTYCPRDRFFYGRHHLDHLGRHHVFVTPDHMGHQPHDYRVFRDIYSEVGIPRDHVRGLTVAKDGRPAREHVSAVERLLPPARQRSIQERFRVNPERDQERLRQTSEVERWQRGPGLQIPSERILKGTPARERLRPEPPWEHRGRTPQEPRPANEHQPQRDSPFRRSTPAPGPQPRPAPGRAAPRQVPTPAPGGNPNRSSPLPRTAPPSTPRNPGPVRGGASPRSTPPRSGYQPGAGRNSTRSVPPPVAGRPASGQKAAPRGGLGR